MLANLSARRAIGAVIVGGNNLQPFKELYLKNIRKSKGAYYFKTLGMDQGSRSGSGGTYQRGIKLLGNVIATVFRLATMVLISFTV